MCARPLVAVVVMAAVAAVVVVTAVSLRTRINPIQYWYTF